MTSSSMGDVEPDSESDDFYDCVETNNAIFNGMTAWFSESVRDSLRQKWIENGGNVRSDGMAMFYFSEDSDDKDTQRLFLSDQYLCDCLTIFHASYVDAVIAVGSVHNVRTGDYVLPPSILYRAYKEADIGIAFAWETWIIQNGGYVPSKTIGRRKRRLIPAALGIAESGAVEPSIFAGSAKRRSVTVNCCSSSPWPAEDKSRRRTK